jgi:hypothetical protein
MLCHRLNQDERTVWLRLQIYNLNAWLPLFHSIRDGFTGGGGVHSHYPLARGSAGGAIFHDNASWWPGGTHSMLRDCRKIGNASNCALVQCGRLLHLLFGGIFGTLTESNRRRPHDCSDWHSYMTVLAAPRGSQYSRNSNAIVFGSIMQCSENLDYSQRVKEQPAV